MVKVANSRGLAAQILSRLLEGKGSLTNLLAQHSGHDEYGLLQESCFGVCRWQQQLDYLLQQLLQRPLKDKDRDLYCLLLVGLYQLRNLSTPDYAVINESVAAAAALKKPWAKGLINGVLRNFQRRRDELEANLASRSEPALRFAHPPWLVEQLQEDWPQQWQALLENNNRRPPMTLRVNLSRDSRAHYQARLRDAGIDASPGKLAPSSLYLDQPLPVNQLPEFADGAVSVQDEASQLVPDLLELAPGQRLLDACAAPGGKTCHILESERSLSAMVAVDEDPGRLDRIRENLDRLQLQARLEAADAAALDAWWNGEAFDRILLDAPCSATGVIRRHPDIKLLRQQADLGKLRQLQQRLLTALWPALKPGGLLLYTTCSVLRQENEAQIEAFLGRTADAKYERITADWGVECRYGRQLLTSDNKGPDGFFFARLRKT